MIDVSIVNHGGEGVLGVVSGKLVPHMFIPEVAQKFRAKARLCTGLRFVIHISEEENADPSSHKLAPARVRAMTCCIRTR